MYERACMKVCLEAVSAQSSECIFLSLFEDSFPSRFFQFFNWNSHYCGNGHWQVKKSGGLSKRPFVAFSNMLLCDSMFVIDLVVMGKTSSNNRGTNTPRSPRIRSSHSCERGSRQPVQVVPSPALSQSGLSSSPRLQRRGPLAFSHSRCVGKAYRSGLDVSSRERTQL